MVNVKSAFTLGNTANTANLKSLQLLLLWFTKSMLLDPDPHRDSWTLSGSAITHL